MSAPTKQARDSWRAANKGRIAAYQVIYNHRHPEKRAAWNSAWKKRNKSNGNAHKASREAAILGAIPCWFEREKVETIYRKAAEYGMHVDHIVPLISDLVCGLHCWHNLQLLAPSENSKKSNRVWPDMPSSGGLVL